MKLGYWKTKGGTPLKSHCLKEMEDAPVCGHAHDPGVSTVTWWPGKVNGLECHNCLRVLAAECRRHIEAIDRRLAGKDGIQRDAFMQ
jgi:hypothetical protein